MAAFLGVLLLGTIYGVVIGVILSFIDVFVRAVVPPRAYLGCIPGKDGFYALIGTGMPGESSIRSSIGSAEPCSSLTWAPSRRISSGR